MTDDAPLNLRTMLRAVQPLLLTGGLSPMPPRRQVELLDLPSGDITREQPLLVHGHIDGIQATRLLTWRPGHRPAYLAAVAAGLLTVGGRRISGVRSQLALLCSHRDAAWATSLPGGCPVVLLDALLPDGLERDAARWVDTSRRGCEHAVLTGALADTEDWVVLDGSLRDLDDTVVGDAPRVIGAVKTMVSQYLMDEHLLVHDLPEGAVSPAFLLPAERNGRIERASCYLRQRDATGQPWTHGLVRVEVPAAHAALLPNAARALLAGRQTAGNGDSRWDRQQLGVAILERGLRALLPHPLQG